MAKAWFVVTTKPQQETRAAIELANQNFPVFLPVIDFKPMFPRYIFVNFDRETDSWGAIQNTRGCTGILKNGFLPAAVPEVAMEAIRAYTPAIEPTPSEAEYTKGQAVQIIEGPCSGVQGLFVADEKRRIFALLDIMGKHIKIPRASIRAA